MKEFRIDVGRLERSFDELAQFTDAPGPGITRVAFTPPDMRARTWLKDQCTNAGLKLREDAVGNLFARWEGADPFLPAIGTGSHIDAIPHSGRFDGTVGVLGGLEAIRTLREFNFKPKRSIELLLFTSEEPTRFGIGCLGSRLLSKSLGIAQANELHDRNGLTLSSIRKRSGFRGIMEHVALARKHYGGFIELHIEQGPILERESIPIGIVESIAAPAALRVTFEGEGGHAGSVLMRDRHDAFLGAAELALAVEEAALSTASIDSVGTTGVCQITPGAVNSIPSRATLEIDVRDINLERRDTALRKIENAAAVIAAKRSLHLKLDLLNADAPALCDAELIETIERSCRNLNLRSKRMVSRAYHDSLFLSRVCPVTMIFIPCRNGYSHRPDEYADPEAIATGVAVLAETLRHLASE